MGGQAVSPAHPRPREELVAASEAMGKLGRDVEGHLRGFGKAAKEHARQAKDALAAAKECEAAVAATRDAQPGQGRRAPARPGGGAVVVRPTAWGLCRWEGNVGERPRSSILQSDQISEDCHQAQRGGKSCS